MANTEYQQLLISQIREDHENSLEMRKLPFTLIRQISPA